MLDGGPGKDGIPAIDAPVFLSIAEASEAMTYLRDEMQGIVVLGEEEVRFYSYAIMNRHEIVNDVLDGEPIAVTFCPLCGSAIVFDRRVNDETLRFGVSGKLRQSNLLMYDDITESLWSQARGEAVVGAYTDTKLAHVTSDVMTRKQFIQTYPQGRVLSDETGYERSYARAPYGDYDTNDQLYFPVSNTDVRLPKKEILYVVQDAGESIAFVRRGLQEAGSAEIDVAGRVYTATIQEGSIRVLDPDGQQIPGYHEMFFSRATQHPGSKWLWEG